MRMLLGMEDLKTTVYAKFDGGEGVGLRECTMRHSKIENHLFPNTVKPLLSGHLGVVKIAQCLLTINIQWLLCTVIKLHVVKEAIQRSSSLPFITNFHLFVNAKTLTVRISRTQSNTTIANSVRCPLNRGF